MELTLRKLEPVDAPLLQALVDTPDVGSMAGLPKTWSAVIALDRAFVYAWGEPLRGAFVLHERKDGTVGPHVLIHPDARGEEAVLCGKAMVAILLHHGYRIVGRTPRARRDALAYAYAIGMQRIGSEGDEVITEAACGC